MYWIFRHYINNKQIKHMKTDFLFITLFCSVQLLLHSRVVETIILQNQEDGKKVALYGNHHEGRGEISSRQIFTLYQNITSAHSDLFIMNETEPSNYARIRSPLFDASINKLL